MPSRQLSLATPGGGLKVQPCHTNKYFIVACVHGLSYFNAFWRNATVFCWSVLCCNYYNYYRDVTLLPLYCEGLLCCFFFYIFHYFKCGLGSQVKMAMVEKKKKIKKENNNNKKQHYNNKHWHHFAKSCKVSSESHYTLCSWWGQCVIPSSTLSLCHISPEGFTGNIYGGNYYWMWVIVSVWPLWKSIKSQRTEKGQEFSGLFQGLYLDMLSQTFLIK